MTQKRREANGHQQPVEEGPRADQGQDTGSEMGKAIRWELTVKLDDGDTEQAGWRGRGWVAKQMKKRSCSLQWLCDQAKGEEARTTPGRAQAQARVAMGTSEYETMSLCTDILAGCLVRMGFKVCKTQLKRSEMRTGQYDVLGWDG